jgi:hypothetical protein
MTSSRDDRASRDPFLAQIPDPRLSGFDGLPRNEQKWRARIYVAVYQLTGSAPFSWAIAMETDPEQIAMMKAFLANTTDERILAGPNETDPLKA